MLTVYRALGLAAYSILYVGGMYYGANACYEWGIRSADRRYEAQQLMETSREVENQA